MNYLLSNTKICEQKFCGIRSAIFNEIYDRPKDDSNNVLAAWTVTRFLVLQPLSYFSRADWLIFIINKSKDGWNLNLWKLLISIFRCQTVQFLTNEVLWTILSSQSKSE